MRPPPAPQHQFLEQLRADLFALHPLPPSEAPPHRAAVDVRSADDGVYAVPRQQTMQPFFASATAPAPESEQKSSKNTENKFYSF
jgi:hypothetical protein